jgi:hypothetical protein
LICEFDTTVRRFDELWYVVPVGAVMVRVSPEAKLLPRTVRVYVLPSATHDEHDALDTVGVAGGTTLNVVDPLLPLELSTMTLQVPAVPMGGMMEY